MAMGTTKEAEEGVDPIFAEINITPLTDIFLVLLIIFMVTSSLIAADEASRSGLRINLPKGATREISQSARDISITITDKGKIVVDGKEVAADTLKAIFDAARVRDPDTQVMVHADEETHYGKVVAVMELAKAAGLKHLGMATRRGK